MSVSKKSTQLTRLMNPKFKPQHDMIIRILSDKPSMSMITHGKNTYLVFENDIEKLVVGIDYNYMFNKQTGAFARWGKTLDDDPQYSPIGPEIADVEISVNDCSGGCSFCYKGNSNKPGQHMSLKTWKTILAKFPRTLTQVAFGITDLDANPDFLDILRCTRNDGVIPNFTTHGLGLTKELAETFSKLCGAIAVSAYTWNKDVCYNAVELLTNAGMKQINIHIVVSNDTYSHVMQVLQDRLTDPRLKNLNAIVFLGLKPKGRASGKIQDVLKIEKYQALIEFCMSNNIAFGFDSCSAQKFEKCISNMNLDEKEKAQLIKSSEGCESDSMSIYINVSGIAWHCSFTEEEETFRGLDVIQAEDFLQDIWYNPCVVKFRQKSIESGKADGCRKCIVFPSINI